MPKPKRLVTVTLITLLSILILRILNNQLTTNLGPAMPRIESVNGRFQTNSRSNHENDRGMCSRWIPQKTVATIEKVSHSALTAHESKVISEIIMSCLHVQKGSSEEARLDIFSSEQKGGPKETIIQFNIFDISTGNKVDEYSVEINQAHSQWTN